MLGTDGDYFIIYGIRFRDDTGTNKGTNTLDEIGAYYWNLARNLSIKNVWSTSLLNKTNLNSNFTTKIGTTWSNKIATTTWKVGGNTYANIKNTTVSNAYKNEITTPATNTTVNAKVGLMYVSDYMYAASPTYWTLVGNDSSDATKDYRTAINDNWMYMGLYEWTITPCTDYGNAAFDIKSTGNVSFSAVNELVGAIRPVFSLGSSVTYASGSGTQDSPILITD